MTGFEHSFPKTVRRAGRFQPERCGIAPLEFLMALPCLVLLFALIFHGSSLIRQKYQLENTVRHETWKGRYSGDSRRTAQAIPSSSAEDHLPPALWLETLPLHSTILAQYLDPQTLDNVKEKAVAELQRPEDFLRSVESDIQRYSDDARRQLDDGMATLSAQKQKVNNALDDFASDLKAEVNQKNTELKNSIQEQQNRLNTAIYDTEQRLRQVIDGAGTFLSKHLDTAMNKLNKAGNSLSDASQGTWNLTPAVKPEKLPAGQSKPELFQFIDPAKGGFTNATKKQQLTSGLIFDKMGSGATANATHFVLSNSWDFDEMNMNEKEFFVSIPIQEAVRLVRMPPEVIGVLAAKIADKNTKIVETLNDTKGKLIKELKEIDSEISKYASKEIEALEKVRGELENALEQLEEGIQNGIDNALAGTKTKIDAVEAKIKKANDKLKKELASAAKDLDQEVVDFRKKYETEKNKLIKDVETASKKIESDVKELGTSIAKDWESEIRGARAELETAYRECRSLANEMEQAAAEAKSQNERKLTEAKVNLTAIEIKIRGQAKTFNENVSKEYRKAADQFEQDTRNVRSELTKFETEFTKERDAAMKKWGAAKSELNAELAQAEAEIRSEVNAITNEIQGKIQKELAGLEAKKNEIQSKLTDVKMDIESSFDGAREKALAKKNEIEKLLKEETQKLADVAKEESSAAIDEIKNFVRNCLEKYAREFTGFNGANLLSQAKAAAEQIAGGPDSTLDTFKQLGDKYEGMAKKIEDLINDKWNEIKNKLEAEKNRLEEQVNETKQQLDRANGYLQELNEDLQRKTDKIKEEIARVENTIGTMSSEIGEQLRNQLDENLKKVEAEFAEPIKKAQNNCDAVQAQMDEVRKNLDRVKFEIEKEKYDRADDVRRRITSAANMLDKEKGTPSGSGSADGVPKYIPSISAGEAASWARDFLNSETIKKPWHDNPLRNRSDR